MLKARCVQADILNRFRRRVLGTGSLFSLRHYHRPLAHAAVPTSYTFSPALVPPPSDWPVHVHVTGFCRLEAAAATHGYTPPLELEAFLEAGPPPVYVGFGSMTLPDAQKVTRTVFAAVRETGVRAIVSKGALTHHCMLRRPAVCVPPRGGLEEAGVAWVC